MSIDTAIINFEVIVFRNIHFCEIFHLVVTDALLSSTSTLMFCLANEEKIYNLFTISRETHNKILTICDVMI